MRLPQPTGVLLTLDADLERLPSGEVRKTLKVLALLSSGRSKDLPQLGIHRMFKRRC
jgi:hypothetical protein